MYSSSSKVYLSTVLLRIIQMPYEQQQVSRKDRCFCTLCTSVFTFNVEDEAWVLFIIMWHMIVLFFCEVVSWATCDSLVIWVFFFLFIYYCFIISHSSLWHSPFGFHRPVDPHRWKGDYSNVALNPIRMICKLPLNAFVKFY